MAAPPSLNKSRSDELDTSQLALDQLPVLIRQAFETQANAAGRIAVHDFGIGNYLLAVRKRNANQSRIPPG